MKMPAIIPAGICVVAGILLSGNELCEYFIRGNTEFDIFPFAVGLYFIGKGLFIHALLDGLSAFRQKS